MLATPTTLMTLLRTAAYAWQEATLTDNARRCSTSAASCTSGSALGEHVDKLGRALTGSVGDYNAAVGSLETRVLVTARKLPDLDRARTSRGPRPGRRAVRPLSAAELVASAPGGRGAGAPAGGLDEVEVDPRYGLDEGRPRAVEPARGRSVGDRGATCRAPPGALPAHDGQPPRRREPAAQPVQPRRTGAAGHRPAATAVTPAAGLTAPGVVVVVSAASLVGMLLDSFTGGGIGWLFGAFFVVASAVRRLQVRRNDLAWAVIVPPLVFAVLVFGHARPRAGGLLSKVVTGMNDLLDYGPMLWIGTGRRGRRGRMAPLGRRFRRAPRP